MTANRFQTTAVAAAAIAMVGMTAGCGVFQEASIQLTVKAGGLVSAAKATVNFTLIEDGVRQDAYSFDVDLAAATDGETDPVNLTGGKDVSVLVTDWTEGGRPADLDPTIRMTPQLVEGFYAVDVVVPPGMTVTAPPGIELKRGDNILALTFAPLGKGGFTQADLDAAAKAAAEKASEEVNKICADAVAGTHPAAQTCAAAIAALQGDVTAAQAAQAQAEAARDAAAAEVTRLQAALQAALARCEQAPTTECDTVIADLRVQIAAAQAAVTAAQAAQVQAEAARDAAAAEAARLERELEERTQSWICVQAGSSTAPTAPAAGVTVTIPGFPAGNPRSWMDTSRCFTGAVFGPLAVGVRPTVVVSRRGVLTQNSVTAQNLIAGENLLNIQSFIP
ncbi:hypothetical protein HZA43_02135 [Candidatus Peregrinibacteria bacterium]|nr:hypothetical protein [Candidatus Peregrinibacteria bacterium]